MKFLRRFFAWYPNENRHHRQTLEKITVLTDVLRANQKDGTDWSLDRKLKARLAELVEELN